jgi:orc1/cdc6 family replication initiation protein
MVNGIIADPEVLEEEYIPQNIPCREVQKKELVFCFSPIERGMKPLDCLCHGKPGTGKTALVKYILQQIQETTNAFALYVNCWENKTLNLILDRIVEQLSLVIAEKGYSVRLSRVKQKIENRPCVIALDEVDKLERKDLNDILYMMKEIGKVGIVCISNTRKYVLDLDPRAISRMRFTSIEFPVYSNEELLTILKHRVIDCGALFPNTYTFGVLERIADLAAGDARVAIQSLRNAASIAEKLNRLKISEEDVEKGYEEVKEIKRKYYLERLTPHHKLLVDIVRKNPQISSENFYNVYKLECKKLLLNAKSSRTFSNYVKELVGLGYLKFERAKVKGNVRLFKTV